MQPEDVAADGWQTLATEHLDFARNIARQCASRMPLPPEDVESAAMLGLVQAARAYRPEGGSFRAFAEFRIKGAIQDQARDLDDLTRDHRRAVKAGRLEAPRRVDYDDVADRVSGDLPGVAGWSAAADTQRLLRKLPRRMQSIVRRHFAEGATLKTIGEELGVTESRVCQILAEATERIRLRSLPYEQTVNPAARAEWLKGGHTRRKAHCLRGHPLEGYNLVVRMRLRGGVMVETRTCRRCRNEGCKRSHWKSGTRPIASYRPARHPFSKLSDEQVREILVALTAGERVTRLSERFKVARRVIRLIRDGKGYRRVARPAGYAAPPSPPRKLSKADARDIIRRLLRGERAVWIARLYEVAQSTIVDIRRGRTHAELTKGLTLPAGRDVPSALAKLTPEQVREVRAELARGTRRSKIARRFGVSWHAIDRIRLGTRYRRGLYKEPNAEAA